MRRFPLAVATLTATAVTLIPTGAASAAPAPVTDPASVVNPFIGTSNAADDFPGADVPFGMVQWSPDTPSRPDGGGYEYNDRSILGFSLTHLAGPGCDADGDVPILPTVGGVNTGATDSFSHANEQADAGYYSVGLDNGVRTELTTTTRSGMARFTFPATTQANLIFKLNGSQTPVDATSWQVISNTEVAGSVTSGHFCGAGFTYTAYFDIVFDHPFTRNGLAAAAAPKRTPSVKVHGAAPRTTPSAAPKLAGPQSSYVTFDTSSARTVQAKVGLSYVSAANAVANRTAENSGWNFDATHTAAHNSWNSMLGKVRISGGTTAQQQVFYTALYHVLLHPNVFSDTNGQYVGFDRAVHTVGSGHAAQYANFSGWDIYRSQAQLSALVAPTQTSDIAQSMLTDYAQGGGLPKWSQNNGETYVMVGDPADPILAGYYAFGARNFDTATALKDMVHQATAAGNWRPGVNYLNSPGYLPSDSTYHCCNFYGPVSTLLEYNSADFAVSAFAGALGDTTNKNLFANRAQNWRNAFNPASGFMQPKMSDGSWRSGFNPASGTDFVEGTSWQYTGMVPFNVRGLADAVGGNAKLESYLDSALSQLHGESGTHADLGNEPSLYLPWEYDYIGRPYKAQAAVRRAQDQIWTNQPGGLAGNDDLGAMSSWYVFSALGVYPESPGTADLALGSPLFPNAVLTLPSGKTLTIDAPAAADNAPYVQSAAWNGTSWNKAYAPTGAITAGGTLSFTLGTTANTSWASTSDAAPPSYPGTANGVPTTHLTSGIAGKCADVKEFGTGDGAVVQLMDCRANNAQRWYRGTDGTVQSMGGCLDVSNSGTAAGTKVQYWECNGSGAQQWQVSGTTLVNPESGRCLDDPNSSTTNGTQLQIYDCNGSAAQKWTLSG